MSDALRQPPLKMKLIQGRRTTIQKNRSVERNEVECAQALKQIVIPQYRHVPTLNLFTLNPPEQRPLKQPTTPNTVEQKHHALPSRNQAKGAPNTDTPVTSNNIRLT